MKSEITNIEANFELSFEPFINYESILCVMFPKSQYINAACMGVHFTQSEDVYLYVYEGSHTRDLLKTGVVFALNFSDNFYEYARAALFGKDRMEETDEIPRDQFDFFEPAPVLKSAWGYVLCEVQSMPERVLPDCKRAQSPNIRARILKKHISCLPRIFNNRSQNLAFEALILSTRIPLYEPYSNIYNESLKFYQYIKKKISQWQDMVRFHESFQLMDNYLLKFGVKAQDLFVEFSL